MLLFNSGSYEYVYHKSISHHPDHRISCCPVECVASLLLAIVDNKKHCRPLCIWWFFAVRIFQLNFLSLSPSLYLAHLSNCFIFFLHVHIPTCTEPDACILFLLRKFSLHSWKGIEREINNLRNGWIKGHTVPTSLTPMLVNEHAYDMCLNSTQRPIRLPVIYYRNI